MPYIITTKQPADVTATSFTSGTEYSSRAVATLDEAREHIIWNVCDAVTLDAAGGIPETGGTVGPLPNGRVIEVQQATYDALAGLVFDRDDYAPMFEADILAAFNAQAVR